MIYVLLHKTPNFSGFVGGVDFCGGIGSTSVKTDRDVLVDKLGFTDVTADFFKDSGKAKEEKA
jgi:hypothetical protein